MEILLLSTLSCCARLKITNRVVFSSESSIFSLSKFNPYKLLSVFEPMHASLFEVILSAPSELLKTGINLAFDRFDFKASRWIIE